MLNLNSILVRSISHELISIKREKKLESILLLNYANINFF